MPNSCWGRYARVAVVAVDREVLPAGEPKMISARAIGVKTIVRTWEKCHVGSTERSAVRRAIAEADELAAALNTLDTHGLAVYRGSDDRWYCDAVPGASYDTRREALVAALEELSERERELESESEITDPPGEQATR